MTSSVPRRGKIGMISSAVSSPTASRGAGRIWWDGEKREREGEKEWDKMLMRERRRERKRE